MRKMRKAAVAVLASAALAVLPACQPVPAAQNTLKSSVASLELLGGHHVKRGKHGKPPSHKHGKQPDRAAPTPVRLPEVLHIDFPMPHHPGDGAEEGYQQMIRELWQTGHPFHETGMYETQARPRADFIRVRIETDRGPLALWFTAGNLYLQAFQNNAGRIYYVNTFDRLRDLREVAGTDLETTELPFGATYDSMRQVEIVNPNMPFRHEGFEFKFETMRNAANGLAGTNWRPGENARRVARYVRYLVQYTAESARWRFVNTIMQDAMRTGDRFVIPEDLLQWEHEWGHLSEWARERWANHDHVAYMLPDRRTINNLAELATIVLMLQSPQRSRP